jgi:hypothetical protein
MMKRWRPFITLELSAASRLCVSTAPCFLTLCAAQLCRLAARACPARREAVANSRRSRIGAPRNSTGLVEVSGAANREGVLRTPQRCKMWGEMIA